MIDKLIIKDIHLTASNDDQYFVFEDVLYQVVVHLIITARICESLQHYLLQIMLCFSRDSDILQYLDDCSNYMQVVLKGKPPAPENTLTFPPNGVIPFHGFTMYGK